MTTVVPGLIKLGKTGSDNFVRLIDFYFFNVARFHGYILWRAISSYLKAIASMAMSSGIFFKV